MAGGADTRRSRELGPDPRLNAQGVPLTRRQYGVLAVIAVLIGGGLVLALLGIAYGLPPGTTTGAPRIVLTGSGRATVTVEQGGAAQHATVALPWTVPIDRTSTDVAVAARSTGGAELTCTVSDGAGRTTQQVSGTAIDCEAVLR